MRSYLSTSASALVFALPAIASGSAAIAQTAPAKGDPAPADVVPEVVVKGQKAEVKSSIDRRTYDVSKDLMGATGSISDVLGNLPSVDVDLQGNVSLRGGGVQILIDGKPSVLVNGANRAATLQQMPANTVESIEIMTNPSAEFKPDGSGGIINIVTKKARPSGRTGSVRFVASNEAKYTLGLTTAYKAGKTTFAGNLNLSDSDTERVSGRDRTQTDPATLAQIHNRQNTVSGADRRSVSGSIGVDHDFTPRDRISASLSHNQMRSEQSSSNFVIADSQGSPILDYDRVGRGQWQYQNTEASLSYKHTFAEAGRDFRLDVRRGGGSQSSGSIDTNTYRIPASATVMEDRRNGLDSDSLNISADYAQPLAGDAKLKAGYSLQDAESDETTYGGVIDPLTGASTSLPNVTNHFVSGQVVHALYATYQRPIGKWTVLGGLRLEQVGIDTNQLTTNLVDHSDDFSVYPSLHLQYDLTDHQKLRASYSHRVTRVSGEQLNPFVVYTDSFNAYGGNPRLKPQDSHSVDASWEYNKGGRNVLASLFLRRNYNSFATITTLNGPVLFRTVGNLGESSSGGLEIAATGKLSEALSYNVSGSASYREYQNRNLLLTPNRSATAFNGRARLNYKLSPNDLLQLTASYSGKYLTAQGYTAPNGSVNLGYQRKVRSDLYVVATVSDIFKSARGESIIDTPVFHDISSIVMRRTVSLSITKQFGGRSIQDGQFEYSSQSAPAP